MIFMKFKYIIINYLTFYMFSLDIILFKLIKFLFHYLDKVV